MTAVLVSGGDSIEAGDVSQKEPSMPIESSPLALQEGASVQLIGDTYQQSTASTDQTSNGHISTEHQVAAVDTPGVVAAASDVASSADHSGLSKNARKRLLKQQRWDNGRDQRKAKFKQVREEQRQSRLAQGLSANPPRKRHKKEQIDSGIRIAIDCSFESYMTDQEVKSTIVQLGFCYSANRQHDKRVTLAVTSFTPTLQSLMTQRTSSYLQWKDMEFHPQPYSELFDPASCVYLTADSPNVLLELDQTKVYVVGGIVDRNRHKSLCFNEALRSGASHARFPLDSHIDMASRKVLTINHVVDILVRYANSGDWKDAFLNVLPQRKGAKSKSSLTGSVQDSDLDQNDDENDDENDEDVQGCIDGSGGDSDRENIIAEVIDDIKGDSVDEEKNTLAIVESE
ncbi:hypothetical protein BASA62_000096 [Batrachochytrium salamandrivorans]|nr:hypothetical protein BASA62_000096 [Batrachochytrium salamandrivorans]